MFVKQTKENLFIWKPNNVGVKVDWSCDWGSENQQTIYFKGNHLTPVQMVQEVKIKPFLLSCWLRCYNKSYTVLLKRLVGYLKRIFSRVLSEDPKSSESRQSQISSPGLNSLSCSCHYSCQSYSYTESGRWN